ncbi:MAG: class F sortase [Candidatus Spechtbacterales bacterium]
MLSEILSKRRLLSAAVLSGLTLFVALFLYFIPQSLSQGGSAPLTANISALQKIVNSDLSTGQVGLPARLKIPVINVDSAVEYVGIAPDGAMDVPKSQDDVAWFELGPLPGANGSAVIAGHYGWKNGKGSAFDNLYKLRKGDKIYIEDDKGVIISFFVVRESRRYDPKADASEVFGSNDGKPHLNLITCEGVWDKVSKTYSKRLVVFTDKE